MEEKKLNPKENERSNILDKLSWEPPKLYSLDKGKTEGGQPEDYSESYTGAPGRS